MGFSREQLAAHEGATVADLVAPRVRLAFVGINPSLWTAATGAHFAHPGNRFYPALYLAGIVDRRIDAADGYTRADLEHLHERGIAITNVVARASVRASDLSVTELRAGGAELHARLARWAPRAVAVVGLTAYRAAFGDRGAQAGEQQQRLGGARTWVLPNPSGLNAHETVESLARAYREPAEASGMPLDPPRW